MELNIGKNNIKFGWLWIIVGIALGTIIGMWSFNGPLTSPLGDYAALPRRMIRLSHIAFIALSIINIMYGYELSKTKMPFNVKKTGSWLMIIGGALMPLFLIVSAFFEAFKYSLVIPAMCILAGLMIMGYYKVRS